MQALLLSKNASVNDAFKTWYFDTFLSNYLICTAMKKFFRLPRIFIYLLEICGHIISSSPQYLAVNQMKEKKQLLWFRSVLANLLSMSSAFFANLRGPTKR